MTTPWNTWIRDLLPSTTRTWTLSVSPGRNSGRSERSEPASRKSSVFTGGLFLQVPQVTHGVAARGGVGTDRKARILPVAAVELPCGRAPARPARRVWHSRVARPKRAVRAERPPERGQQIEIGAVEVRGLQPPEQVR